jgi:hypothetical protein
VDGVVGISASVGRPLVLERTASGRGGVDPPWDLFPRARVEFERRPTYLSAEQRAQIAAFLDEALEG